MWIYLDRKSIFSEDPSRNGENPLVKIVTVQTGDSMIIWATDPVP